MSSSKNSLWRHTLWPWESCLREKSVYTSVPAVVVLAIELHSWGCEQEILASVTLDEHEKCSFLM